LAKSQHTPENTLLRQLLINAREGRKITQASLAAALGKPQSFIAKIEVGERRLDVLEFCAIVRALGLDPLMLLGNLLSALPERFDI